MDATQKPPPISALPLLRTLLLNLFRSPAVPSLPLRRSPSNTPPQRQHTSLPLIDSPDPTHLKPPTIDLLREAGSVMHNTSPDTTHLTPRTWVHGKRLEKKKKTVR